MTASTSSTVVAPPSHLSSSVHPRLNVHLHQRGPNNQAQLEFSARPGSPLGGPFNTGRLRASQRLTGDQLANLHLRYLRQAYQRTSPAFDPCVRQELDHIAASHAWGRNRAVIICDEECVGLNVTRAALAIAQRLPPFEADDTLNRTEEMKQ